MSAWFAPLSDWWRRRTARERLLLQGLGILFAGLFSWYALFIPMRMIANAAEARYARAAIELQDITSAARAFERHAEGQVEDGMVLSDVVTIGAAEMQIVFSSPPAGDDAEVRLALSAADPARMFAWIRKLQNENGILVLNLAAKRSDAGLLDAELVLARNVP